MKSAERRKHGGLIRSEGRQEAWPRRHQVQPHAPRLLPHLQWRGVGLPLRYRILGSPRQHDIRAWEKNHLKGGKRVSTPPPPTCMRRVGAEEAYAEAKCSGCGGWVDELRPFLGSTLCDVGELHLCNHDCRDRKAYPRGLAASGRLAGAAGAAALPGRKLVAVAPVWLRLELCRAPAGFLLVLAVGRGRLRRRRSRWRWRRGRRRRGRHDERACATRQLAAGGLPGVGVAAGRPLGDLLLTPQLVFVVLRLPLSLCKVQVKQKG